MMNRLKISLMLAPIPILLVIGSYVYSLWAAEKRKANELPVEAVSMMMRDLLSFHKKRGSFPRDLKELEGAVWERKKNREFSIGNRGLGHRNYFYLYTQITPHRFTLWAIPTGEMREEGPTWFLTVTPDVCRRWKGAALGLENVRNININPSAAELGVFGLFEQSAVRLDMNTKSL